ncbi:hypothetical protein Nepgr_032842 [Nepenthes gracilis]|uniref:Pentatricopeptide repeat-containing protein n=1 Tax=Nepenthes gracilis TaxID=150966 RepID=A0AAD3TKS4_NEPGR|nr:hypothetical protein Nepgr_032842 [Nepenthes gracilis]
MRSASEFNSLSLRIIQHLDICNSPNHIYQIKAQLIVQNLHSDTQIAYRFINACQSQKLLDSALCLFSQLPRLHIFTCNTLLRAFSHAHSFGNSLSLYSHMHKNSISPNNYTFPFILKSLSDGRGLKLGQSVHTQIVKLGNFDDIYVQNSILDLYASCGEMGLCGKVFDEMPQRDVVSWTVLLNGHRMAGKFDEALVVFMKMQDAGVVPNQVTMVNALAACASFGALEMGIWIHDCIRRNGWDLDVVLGTVLIHMYGKCGKIEDGVSIFQCMKKKNAYTWNALIKGFALAENGGEVLSWFSKMENGGIKPDEVTLITVISACAHSGLVQEAREIFCSLLDGKYGFSPGVKHYACMVDLLARSGCLEDAVCLIREMPFEPTITMWGALLAGGRIHRDFNLCEFVAWKLVELEPANGAHYVVLSNLYADMGRWTDVCKVRDLMKARGMTKDLASSQLEYENQKQICM